MCKKNIIAALALVITGTAHATTSNGVAGGTITFHGSVTDTTCNVTTGSGSDFTVNLKPVTTEQVGTATGLVTHNAEPFKMKVSGCKNSSAKDDDTLKITFNSSNVSDDEKYLKNYSGSAQGVGIALTADGTTPVNFDEAIDTLVKSSQASTTEGKEISFYANYYNYGGSDISSGNIVTDATYTFSYE